MILTKELTIYDIHVSRGRGEPENSPYIFSLLAGTGYEDQSFIALTKEQLEEKVGVSEVSDLSLKTLVVSLTLREGVEVKYPPHHDMLGSDDVVPVRSHMDALRPEPYFITHFQSGHTPDELKFPREKPVTTLLVFNQLPYYSLWFEGGPTEHESLGISNGDVTANSNVAELLRNGAVFTVDLALK